MKNCHHPNIVRLIEEFETEEEIYLVLEYVKVQVLLHVITHQLRRFHRRVPYERGFIFSIISSQITFVR